MRWLWTSLSVTVLLGGVLGAGCDVVSTTEKAESQPVSPGATPGAAAARSVVRTARIQAASTGYETLEPNWSEIEPTSSNVFADLRAFSRDEVTPNWHQEVHQLEEARIGLSIFTEHAFDRGESVYRSGYGHYRVAITEQRIVCRRHVHTGDRGKVFFEPGTANPVGYLPPDGCLTEQKEGGSRRDEKVCDFRPSAETNIHGFTWSGEVESADSAMELSRRRVRVLQKSFERTRLPEELGTLVAHGTSKTLAEAGDRKPVVGALFTVFVADPEETMLWREFQTTRWDAEDLAKTMKIIRKKRRYFGDRRCRGPSATLTYRTEQGERRTVERRCPDPPTALGLMYRWGFDMVQAKCDITAVGPPWEHELASRSRGTLEWLFGL